MRRALFLDRDGVINVNHGYVHRQEEFQFIEGIFDLCRYAHAHGWLIVVVTNQAGIARGLYTEGDFARLTAWMTGRFMSEGAPITAVYYCPTHPTAGQGAYRCESFRRKPNPGMIIEAAQDHAIDLAASVLIGDKASDIAAGQAAGIHKCILFCPAGSDSDDSIQHAVRVATLGEVTAALATGSV